MAVATATSTSASAAAPTPTATSTERIAVPAPGPTQPAVRRVVERLPRWRRVLGQTVTAWAVVALLFFVFVFIGSDLAEARHQRHLRSELSAHLTQASAAGDVARPGRGRAVALLEVPRLGLVKVVLDGAGASELKRGPGLLTGAPIPGAVGNAVIAGRRATYGKPFGQLDSMRPGDDLVVTTAAGRARWIVEDVRRVKPGDPDVLGPTARPRLTLITSDPPVLATGRLAVTATLAIAAPGDVGRLPTSGVLPVAIAPAESALSGEATAAAPAIIFGQLLALALVLAFALYRRWSFRTTWLLTTPVVLALVLLLFENLDRLLPATL